MGLQSAFDLVLNSDLPLTAINDLIWQSLEAGAKSKQHPWNLGSFTTVETVNGNSIRPMSRTVVLRRADRAARSLDLFTDLRSEKVEHLESSDSAAPVCWLFYEASTKIQLRLQGRAEIIDGEEADAEWRGMTVEGRSNFCRSLGLALASHRRTRRTPPIGSFPKKHPNVGGRTFASSARSSNRLIGCTCATPIMFE